MTQILQWLSSKAPTKNVFPLLLLIVSVSLAGCGNAERIIVEAPDLPDIPKELKACIEKHVTNLPKGKWSKTVVLNIIGRYQRREVQLEECGYGLIEFYKTIQVGLRTRRVR